MVKARAKTQEEIDAENAAIAKANKQMTTIGVVFVIIIALIIGTIGFFIWKGSQPKTADMVPSFVTNKGAIVITKDGVDKNGARWNNINSQKENTINHLPVLGNGQDPLCPGCGAVEREIGKTVKYWVKEGKLVYKQYPISIMNRLSNGKNYSTRVSAAFYRMAEVAPEHYLDFVELMYDESVQPSESAFQDIPDEKLAEYAEKAGATKEQAQQVIDGKYKDYVDANSDNLSNDESLYRTGSDGTPTFMTPLVIVNGTVVDDFSTSDFTGWLADRLGLQVPSDSELEKVVGSTNTTTNEKVQSSTTESKNDDKTSSDDNTSGK